MSLVEKRNELMLQKMKLDKFFSMFLEKFERKMDKDKLKEYDKVNQEIRNTEYWMKKEQYV
jgi:hypothetical protein